MLVGYNVCFIIISFYDIEPFLLKLVLNKQFDFRYTETSLGDEMTPHTETLEKSRVSVILMPKIYVRSS